MMVVGGMKANTDTDRPCQSYSYSTSFRATDGQFGKLTDSRLGVLLLVAETQVHQQPEQAGN